MFTLGSFCHGCNCRIYEFTTYDNERIYKVNLPFDISIEVCGPCYCEAKDKYFKYLDELFECKE